MSVLGVVGSRDYERLTEVRHYVRARIAEDELLTVVSGGAKGVDAEAERAAEMMGAVVVSYRPMQIGSRYIIVKLTAGLHVAVEAIYTHASSYGAACYARNRLIVEEADEVKAFWNGRSPGTKHSMDLAREAGKLIGPVGVT